MRALRLGQSEVSQVQQLEVRIVRKPEDGIGRMRWFVCALLFLATTTNYMDRQVLGILAPLLQKDLHWTEESYGNMIACFTFAYGLAYLLAGRVVDRFGTRKGYGIFVAIWSVSSAAHAFVSSAFGFGVARFFLGIGESGNFPAALKAVAEWFPKQERALATGIFNSGTNFAALLAPIVIPFHRTPLGMALRLYFHSQYEHALAHRMAALPVQPFAPRRIATERDIPDTCTVGGESVVLVLCDQPRNHRLCQFKISYRPGLVVLSVLGTKVSQRPLPHYPGADERSAGCHLLRRQHRKHLWRLALRDLDQARTLRKL